MFVGEVVIVALILAARRTVNDVAAEGPARIDLIGSFLSAVGLGLVVFGVLRSANGAG